MKLLHKLGPYIVHVLQQKYSFFRIKYILYKYLNDHVYGAFQFIQTFISYQKRGNSVARDLPWTGSETNTTIFVIYIGYRFPLYYLGKPPSS